MSKPSDLVQGTLDLLIMKILALEPLHAWAIGVRLKQVSGDVLQVSDGSLYTGATTDLTSGANRVLEVRAELVTQWVLAALGEDQG